MQNDFIDGALGTKEAVVIVPKVEEKIRNFKGTVFFTRDTHETWYLDTQEGKKLPEGPIIVDAECCAGVTPESHETALKAMKACQIEVVE